LGNTGKGTDVAIEANDTDTGIWVLDEITPGVNNDDQ